MERPLSAEKQEALSRLSAPREFCPPPDDLVTAAVESLVEGITDPTQRRVSTQSLCWGGIALTLGAALTVGAPRLAEGDWSAAVPAAYGAALMLAGAMSGLAGWTLDGSDIRRKPPASRRAAVLGLSGAIIGMLVPLSYPVLLLAVRVLDLAEVPPSLDEVAGSALFMSLLALFPAHLTAQCARLWSRYADGQTLDASQ